MIKKLYVVFLTTLACIFAESAAKVVGGQFEHFFECFVYALAFCYVCEKVCKWMFDENREE